MESSGYVKRRLAESRGRMKYFICLMLGAILMALILEYPSLTGWLN